MANRASVSAAKAPSRQPRKPSATAREDSLQRYVEKRDFTRTSEPKAERARTYARKALSYVIQKHWASRLHYDFRLELDGVLLSWAVPKGPSFDPKDKRMAVQVEDHPVRYGKFEGRIPAKEYGAGTVIVWDRGTWEAVGDPQAGMESGKLVFRLHGEKLAGLWELVRTSKPGEKKQPQWLLFKKRDEWARPAGEYDVISALPDSVIEQPLGLLEKREPKSAITDHANGAASRPRSGMAGATGAVKAALPRTLQPQLATLSKDLPPVGDWLYEIKFDGYRIMARIDGGKARLITRGGHDWTDRLRLLADEIEALGVTSAWLDGEAVVIDADGGTNFNALQNAFDASNTALVSYFIFDAPFFEGYDLRNVPLHARKDLLKKLLAAKGSDRVRFSEDIPADASRVLHAACEMKLEGIIAKRRDAPYVSTRSDTWLKLKCSARQEFVIVGFNDRAGARNEVGGLMLGYYDDGRLQYAGNVGTGWNAATGKDLHKRLSRIEIDTPVVDADSIKPGRWSRRAKGSERWVKPQLVAEVGFAAWTPDGRVRHAVFHGLRDDKRATAITRELAVDASATAPKTRRTLPGNDRVGKVKVSNADRIIDDNSGLTKIDLVRYYESIAERMLPHLKARPVALVRGPNGVGGQLFFQKHDEKLSIPGLRELDPALWPGHAGLLELSSAQALVNAAQMNVIELHTWNATTRNINKPDRLIFDIDPGEGVSWAQVREAAVLVRTLLSELALECWLKTSGGKGLHLVVPIAARLEADTVKDFSRAVVLHLAKTIPSRFVAKSGPSNRIGKIFVDYLRNGHGQTTAAAFSARARPGMGVSMPISWEQLPALKSAAQWTITTAREYLSFETSDPWVDYWKTKQTLTMAMKRMDYKAPRGPAGRD